MVVSSEERTIQYKGFDIRHRFNSEGLCRALIDHLARERKLIGDSESNSVLHLGDFSISGHVFRVMKYRNTITIDIAKQD